VTLGGLFIEIYSFESSLYFLPFLLILAHCALADFDTKLVKIFANAQWARISKNGKKYKELSNE
jgi:hypothetical protein